jgi:hypothetical protein
VTLDEDFAELLDTLVSLLLDCGVTLDEDFAELLLASSQSSQMDEDESSSRGAKLLSSSPQALPSNAATTTILPRTNFFSIKNLTPKYNLYPAPKQPPRDQTH